MSFPFEIKPVEKSVNDELLEKVTGERTGFFQVGKEKWFFPSKYIDQAAGYYNVPLRKDDIWIVTYPRSGTTWTQELLWLVNNNLDYETALNTPLAYRFPFMEFSIFLHKEMKKDIHLKNLGNEEGLKFLELWDEPGDIKVSSMKSPRHIKTHLPLSLLPPSLLDTCKVVYVARNPKDVAVSYYHLYKLMTLIGYVGDFPSFWEYFKKDLVTYSPYWDHIFEGWEKRNHPNMLFLFYEDLTKDLPSSIKKIANFLEKDITEQQVQKLADHLHIDNFKKNPSTNPAPMLKGTQIEGEQAFVRKGGIGGSKDYFTPEMNKEADKWIKEHLEKTDLRFPC